MDTVPVGSNNLVCSCMSSASSSSSAPANANARCVQLCVCHACPEPACKKVCCFAAAHLLLHCHLCSQPWAKRFKQLAAMITQLEQQLAAGGAALPTAAPAAGAVQAQGQPAHPVLTVVSLEGSRLKLHVAGVTQLKLSAYKIDAELLFTTQPFSSFCSSSSSSAGGGAGTLGSACPLPPHRRPSPPEAAADGGLGRVSFAQPTAQASVQLQYGGTAADRAAPGSSADSPAGSATVTCYAMGVTAAGSSGSAAEAGGAVHECVLDLDALLPGMQQLSVLLEVTGAGGLSRSLPRWVVAV